MKKNYKSWIAGLAVAICSTAQVASAQAPYVSFNLGYALPTTGYLMGSTTTGNSTSTTYESNKKGPNTGLNFGINAGYMFSDHVGADLGINYLLGKNVMMTEYTFTGAGGSNNITTESKARSLRIAPALRFSGGFDELNPYARFGLGMYLMNKQTDYEVDKTTSGSITNKDETTTEIKGAFSMGFTSALGMEYKMDNLSIFAEINFYNQSFVYKSSEVTAYKVDGTDMLSALSTRAKKTEYSDKYDESSTPDNNSPNKASVVSMPFSNYSFSLGITMRFE